jgi:hypothetical protein
LKRHPKPEGRRNLPAHLAAYVRDCGRFVSRPARTDLAAPRNFNPADDSFGSFASDRNASDSRAMSALPPNADIRQRNRHVRFMPKSGHWHAPITCSSPRAAHQSNFGIVSGCANGASSMPARWIRPVFSLRFFEDKIRRTFPAGGGARGACKELPALTGRSPASTRQRLKTSGWRGV